MIERPSLGETVPGGKEEANLISRGIGGDPEAIGEMIERDEIIVVHWPSADGTESEDVKATVTPIIR